MKSFFVLMFLPLIALVSGDHCMKFELGAREVREDFLELQYIYADKEYKAIQTFRDYTYDQKHKKRQRTITRVEVFDRIGDVGEITLTSGVSIT